MKDPHVFVPLEPQKKRQLLSPKTLTIVLLVVILVAVAAGLIYWQMNKKKTKEATKTVDTALKAASQSEQKGDNKATLDELKKAEAAATTNEDKVRVYSDLAATYMSTSQPGEALRYYDMKHDLDPDSAKTDAMLLGEYYQRAGENDKAIEQYKIALAYQQSLGDNMGTRMDISAIKARLEELGVPQQ